MSLCTQLCSSGNTAVAKNKRYILQYLNDNGDLLYEQNYKILDELRHRSEYSESDISTGLFNFELRQIIDHQNTLCDFEIDDVNCIRHNIYTQ